MPRTCPTTKYFFHRGWYTCTTHRFGFMDLWTRPIAWLIPAGSSNSPTSVWGSSSVELWTRSSRIPWRYSKNIAVSVITATLHSVLQPRVFVLCRSEIYLRPTYRKRRKYWKCFLFQVHREGKLIFFAESFVWSGLLKSVRLTYFTLGWSIMFWFWCI